MAEDMTIFSRVTEFILSPFVGVIRYGALKLMKYMGSHDDERLIIAMSDHVLNTIIMPSVFNYFRDDSFRRAANFEILSVAEHDRIFNELEVAGICLAIFYLQAVKSTGKLKDYHLWQKTEEYLPQQLKDTAAGYGVDVKNATLMVELIGLRYREYKEFLDEVWVVSNQENKEFKGLSPELKLIGSAIQGIAIGTTDHIRRGKVKEKDPLTQHTITWLLTLKNKIGKFIKNI